MSELLVDSDWVDLDSEWTCCFVFSAADIDRNDDFFLLQPRLFFLFLLPPYVFFCSWLFQMTSFSFHWEKNVLCYNDRLLHKGTKTF